MEPFTDRTSPPRNSLARELLFALGGSALVLAAIFGTYLYLEQESIRAREIAAAQTSLGAARDAVARELDLVRSHLHYLVRSQLVARFIAAGDLQAREEIERDWLRFAESAGRYDQMRLLDLRGHEMLRINHAPEERPISVPVSELQDKSDRYYFRDAVALPSGGVYVSPLDLNVEAGAIEKPYKAMLRFAAPLWHDGRLLGVLVLNYRARRVIDALRAEVESQTKRVMLLNAQGYWLAAPDPADEWGFMLKHERTMEQRHPELWSAMRRERHGRFEDASGIHVYRTIDPLDAGEITSSGRASPDDRSPRKSRPVDAAWILVAWIEPQALEARYAAARRDLGLLFLAALVLVLPLAGYTANMRARHGSAERDLRLAGRVFEATGDAVMVTDGSFRIIRVNPAFTAITGWEFAEVAGQDPETLLSPSHTPSGTCARIKDQLASGGWQGMLWFRRAGGAEFPAFATVSQVTDGRKRMRNCVLVLNDMTDRVREEDRVRMLAERDALTGLPNRRLLDDRLAQSIARARRTDKKLAVLFIDLDRFKQVNDDGGHDAGDTVLQASAHRLTSALRVTDTAARLGGDEFVVLLDEIADRAAAQAVARKIASALGQPVEFAGHAYSVGASIGITLFPEDGDSASALLRAADEEMYAVKARRHSVRERAAA